MTRVTQVRHLWPSTSPARRRAFSKKNASRSVWHCMQYTRGRDDDGPRPVTYVRNVREASTRTVHGSTPASADGQTYVSNSGLHRFQRHYKKSIDAWFDRLQYWFPVRTSSVKTSRHVSVRPRRWAPVETRTICRVRSDVNVIFSQITLLWKSPVRCPVGSSYYSVIVVL